MCYWHLQQICFKRQKKIITINNALQKILDESNRKPNKIWVDKGSTFYHSSMKSWLQDIGIEVYSTHNEEKLVAAERFIRTFQKKMYKYMTSIFKNVHFDKFDVIVKNTTIHIIEQLSKQIKLFDVKSSTYIDFNKENNKEDPKFKFDDQVRISKCKDLFTKGYIPNWSEEVFMLKKVRNTIPWTFVYQSSQR